MNILSPFLPSRTTKGESAALRCFKHFHLSLLSPQVASSSSSECFHSSTLPFKWLHPQFGIICMFYFCLQPHKPCRWVAGLVFFLAFLGLFFGARGKEKPRSCFGHFFVELRKKFPSCRTEPSLWSRWRSHSFGGPRSWGHPGKGSKVRNDLPTWGCGASRGRTQNSCETAGWGFVDLQVKLTSPAGNCSDASTIGQRTQTPYVHSSVLLWSCSCVLFPFPMHMYS